MTALTDPAEVGPVSAPEAGAVERATRTVSLLNLVSRLTGFARVVVMGAVLGATLLGDAYQAANTVPNVVFELFVAGALQAVLVPSLVRTLADRGRDAADRLASTVLGALVVVLGGLAIIAAIGAPVIARLLFSGGDGAARHDQVALATTFLLVFLPQVLFYACGLVATAVLHAHHRFAAPAAAPVVNNVVVSAAYLGFWALHRDHAGSLELSAAEVTVLAGGTTAAVIAFTAVPIVSARRLGSRLRPRFELRDPELRDLARQGAWAGLYLACTQVVLVAAILGAGRVEGGVITFQLAMTYFLLPHALVAIPAFTTAFPLLSAAAHRGDHVAFADRLRTAVSTVVVLGLPATAALAALAPAAARLTLFGRGTDAATDVGHALIAFAPGLLGYGLFLLLTRAAYAYDEVRLPALVHLGVTAAAVVGMLVAVAALDGAAVVVGLATSHSISFTAGALALGVLLRRRHPHGGPWLDRRSSLVAASGAAAGAAVMVVITAAVAAGTRGEAAVSVLAGGGVGLVVMLAVLRAGRVPVPMVTRG